jgi:hypothetical protein
MDNVGLVLYNVVGCVYFLFVVVVVVGMDLMGFGTTLTWCWLCLERSYLLIDLYVVFGNVL